MAPPQTSIAASRWAFLAPYFADWFRASAYGDRDDETSVSHNGLLQFDSFHVYVPTDPSARLVLRRAVELVGLMLAIDADAWWFLLDEFTPWFHSFRPDEYDRATLVPRMTFVLRERFSSRDDPSGAVKKLQELLASQSAREDEEFQAVRSRVRAMVEGGSHQRVPIVVQLTPASSDLRKCIVDTVAMVRAVLCEMANSSDYPFSLEEIRLSVYATRDLCEAQDSLRELFSLNVPVTMKLRRGSPGEEDEPLIVRDLGAMYRALADSRGVSLTLHHRDIFSTFELWSAVAFSSQLTTLFVDQKFREDPVERLEHANWLAYALRQSPSLQSLVLTMYEPTEREFQASRRVAQATDPARELGCGNNKDGAEGINGVDVPRHVVLHANAEILLRDGSSHSLSSLGVTPQSPQPLVRQDAQANRVYFVVPAFAICSASATDVVSIDPGKPTPRHSLTSLSVYSDEERSGVAAEFVDVFGKSLEYFRWTGEPSLLDDGVSDFDHDLSGVLASCPQLQTVSLQYRKLSTVDALVNISPVSRLRSLSLVNVPLSESQLVRLFETLGDRKAYLTRTLEELHLRCERNPMPQDAVEAAIAMLQSNRRLTHLRLGIVASVPAELDRRLEVHRGQSIKLRLPVREKLAFLSAVERSSQSLGQLDASCVCAILGFITESTTRQIEIARL